jgi:hypothetical protein
MGGRAAGGWPFAVAACFDSRDKMTHSRWLWPLAILSLTLSCDVALLLGATPPINLLAGLMLLFVLPGAALLIALPDDVRPSAVSERLILAFGLSVVISMLCFWLAAQLTGFGVIERWLSVESFIISLLSLLALSRINTQHATRNPQSPTPNPQLLITLFVLLVASLLRFPSLGYGEFNDDELDVVQSARSQLLGQSHVIYEHRKGPTEIWFAAVVAGTSTQFDEWTMRLPFAIASLGAIAMTVLLGEDMLGRMSPKGDARGVLAGLILSGEGIFLAFSRMVQYQSIVLLMLTLVAWCAWRLFRTRTQREETFYLAVGALCWSFAILTHWDGVPIGVVLLFALWRKWRMANSEWQMADGRWRMANGYPLSAIRYWLSAVRHSLLAIRYWLSAIHYPLSAIRYLLIFVPTLILPAIFYIQLFLHPQVGNLETYASGRIGFGLFNGAPTFLRHATFYNASFFIIALLLVGAWSIATQLPRGRWLAFGCMIVPFIWPNFLQIADGLNGALLVFALILFALLFKNQLTNQPSNQLALQLLSLWLLACFILYAFLIKQAGLHFYTLMPALALLVAAQVSTWFDSIALNSPKLFSFLRKLIIVPALLLLLLAYAYDTIAYLRPTPEYALRYPQTALWWSPTFYRERPNDFFFAFPYRYGWSVIGELYRRGELRGKFESNETYLVTDWYVRDIEVARNDEPRYYFRVDDSPRAGAVPEDLDHRYQAYGEVRVNGETKIHIYEQKKYPVTTLQIFNAENFPTHDPLRLERSLRYKQFKGDDRAFRDTGRYLDMVADASDVIVLDSPLQDTIIPYYYRGTARLIAPLATDQLATPTLSARTIYAVLWDSGAAERWLAQQAYPLDSQWFGSVRVAAYAPPLPLPVVQKSLAQFGESIILQAYSLPSNVASSGEAIRLALYWRVSNTATPMATRYKIFVHVLDARGQLVAQRDTEPMADLATTTSWKAGEVIVDHHGIRLPANLSPQALRVAVGLYDPRTGVRLPVRDANGNTQSDGRLILGSLDLR